MKIHQIGLPLLLMIVFAFSRWPGVMPDNFSAVYAMVFCSGVFLPRKLAGCIPIVILIITDFALNLYYHQEFFNPYLLVNYACYGIMIWMGTRFNPTSHWLKLTGGGMMGAMFFYLISNSATWIYSPGYAKTLSGWIQSLTVGLHGWPPTWVFFLNTLASGGLFTALFVGTMKFAIRSAIMTANISNESKIKLLDQIGK